MNVDPLRLQTIVFDVDGTLYRQSALRRSMLLRLVMEVARHPAAGVATLRALHAYRRAQEALRGVRVDGGLAEEQLRLASEYSGQTQPDVARIVARWMDHDPLALLRGLVDPALRDLLGAARSRGLRLGVFSDYPAAAKLEAMRLAEFFDVVVSAQDPAVNRFKPDPSGLIETLRRLQVHPRNALYVGDRHDVDGPLACAAGVPCVIVGRRPRPAPDLPLCGTPSQDGQAGPPHGWITVPDHRGLHAMLFASPPPARATTPGTARPTLRGHIAIARIDHWFKNVFVIPGIVTAIGVDRWHLEPHALRNIGVGMLSICLVASSNYVVNELLDAPSDRAHPVKCTRPVPSGQVSVPLAYAQWLALMVLGVCLGGQISLRFALTLLALWGMGCFYNIPPVRSKDLPYVDVLTEAVNNPLRLLAGWFMVATDSSAPASLLLSYWMIGCYFMAMKRFSELRDFGDRGRAAAYRRSFAHYTETRLLVSVMFYGSSAMLFLGAFIMRYRLELILSFPLIAFVMASYLLLALAPHSAVQRPEGLYREPALMGAVLVCAAAMAVLMIVDLPVLPRIFAPTAPTIQAARFAGGGLSVHGAGRGP
jgi:decaprenyl-phosphate phosphoribosyltransferase